MKDYNKEIKELQEAGSKLSDEGNHEVGNMLYLAAVDLEDLWTQYQAILKELCQKFQHKAEIVVNGNCVVCGKPLTDSNLFLCEECQRKAAKNDKY